MTSFKKTELKALISLLDDSDPEVFDHIEEKLVMLGKDVIPILEDAWSKSFDALLQHRIENIVHKIQFDTLKNDLKNWVKKNSDDLLTGMILVAHYQYPDLDENKIREYLNRIKRDAWSEIKEQQPPLEKVHVLNRVLFDMHGFTGNTANFHAPQNSFINTVLETKKGNPLMLCVVYSIIAQQLDIPVYGINLPEHFVLAYQDENKSLGYDYTYPEASVLFYINAFSRGSVFSKKDIDQFLKKLDLKPHKIFFEPCTNVEIVQRSLRNLSFSFQKLGDTEKVNELDELLEYISS